MSRIYTDYLTGRLFQEFAAQTATDPAESQDQPLQADGGQTTTGPYNTEEDYSAEESCAESVIDFRLIGGDQTQNLEEDNLMETSSATNHQNEAEDLGMMVVCNLKDIHIGCMIHQDI